MASMNPSSEMPCENPEWLNELVRTSFFVPCPDHPTASKSRKNLFCIKCCRDSLCHCCVSECHSGHESLVLQIRRCSNMEALRVEDITQLVDITDIQVYVINSAKVVFINSRPQERPSSKGTAFPCEICHRSLIQSNKYCSLQCKLKAYYNEKTVSLMLKSPAALPSSSPVFKVPSPPNYLLNSCTQRKVKAKEVKFGEGKVKEVKVKDEKAKAPETAKGKRKLTVHLKDQCEVSCKDYYFENPTFVSSPISKRKRTPTVILSVVDYQRNVASQPAM